MKLKGQLRTANASLVLADGAAGETTIKSSSTGSRELTLPDDTTTLVGDDTVQELSNKTIDGNDNTITNIDISNSTFGILPISKGGTGAYNAYDALNALLPDQTGNDDTLLATNGMFGAWSKIANVHVDIAAAIAYSKLNLTGSIVNADVSASAGIVDTKLATISTAGKVANSATTATTSNTADAIVARDAAGKITPVLLNANVDGYVDIDEEASPSSPSAGKVRLFAKTDKLLWTKNSTGVETPVGSGSGSGTVNLMLNPYAAIDTSGWVQVPVAGESYSRYSSGGPLSPTITTGYRFTTGGGGAGGHFDYAFSVPDALAGMTIKIEWYQKNYLAVSSEWKIEIKKSGVALPLEGASGATSYNVPPVTGKQTLAFVAPAAGTDYKIVLTSRIGTGNSLDISGWLLIDAEEAAMTSSSGVNAVLNPSAEIDLLGWDTTNIGTATLTRIADFGPLYPIIGTGVLLDGGSGTGQYATIDFQIPGGFSQKKLRLSWYQQVESGYANGDWQVEIRKVIGGARVPLSTDDGSNESNIPAIDGRFAASFQADGGGTPYHIRFTQKVTNAPYLALTMISVDDGSPASITPYHGPTNYTPTFNTGALGTGATKFWYTRSGQMGSVFLEYLGSGAGTAGSGSYTITLPFTVDTSRITSSALGTGNIGTALFSLGTGTAISGSVRLTDSGASFAVLLDDSLTSMSGWSNSSVHNLGTSNLRFAIRIENVPVVGWESTTTAVETTKQSPVRAGSIMPYAGATAPAGWQLCDGSAISQATYYDLFAAIGTAWNTATNPTTASAYSAPSAGLFRVPDLRGVFMRGVGTASGLNAVTLAGYQADSNLSHTHDLAVYKTGAAPTVTDGSGSLQGTTALGRTTATTDRISLTSAVNVSGTSESRPRSQGMNFIIKLWNDGIETVGLGAANTTTAGLVNTIDQDFTGVKNFASGLKLQGSSTLNVFNEGTVTVTFTSNGTGGGSQSVDLRYTKVNNVVSLYVPNFSLSVGSTTATFISSGVLPSILRPQTNTQYAIGGIAFNNGAYAGEPVRVQVETTGVVRISRLNASFAASANAGLSIGQVFTYMVGAGS